MAERPMIQLAEAVADGAAVDWEQFQAGARQDDQPVVEQLRVLAAISSVHRTTQPHPETGPRPLSAAAGGRRWGPLVILSELGEGSQGRVYRALDPQLQREVALKLVRHPANEASAARLVSEARLLARIRHPNVVSVYGADRVGDEVGLWMELVHGRTLASRVATDGPLGAEEAALVGAALCRALAAVHQAGLLHRDIKAQNVVRESGGRVVLMDFGAGRDLLQPAQGRRVIGTPVYLAPEVLAGGPASVQSDVYSLGVLLFFLTTKRFPVAAASLDELHERHQLGRISLLRDVRPDLPAPFVAAVSRALAPNPSDRFESAGRFEEALSLQLTPPQTDAAPPTVDVRDHVRSRSAGIRWTFAAAVMLIGALVVMSVPWVRARFSREVEAPSIAVLPLRNLSGDPAKQYLADSLTDLLITHLTKIKSLRVISFSGVVPFRDQTKSPTELGAALGVKLLLAGGIATDGPAIRTTVQLLDARDGRTVWAEEYTRDPSGLLGQQAEIARTVSARLRLDVPEAVARRLEYRRAVGPDAQDAYLRGVADASADTVSSTQTAVQHFERAVAFDPGFGDAWASLSLARVRMANQSPGPDRAGTYAQARKEALKAIDLDPALGLAYAALGTVRFYYDWDWVSAEDAFKRAVDLAPGDGFAYQRYSMFLAAADRIPEALAMASAAQSIDPLVAVRSTNLGMVYYYGRRYGEAVREFERALGLSPGYAVAHSGLCRAYEASGEWDKARRECQATVDGGSRLVGRLALARVFGRMGRRADAERILADVSAEPQGPFVAADSLALVYASTGDRDRAFAFLEQAVASRSGNMLWIRVDPRFDPLRDDARFRPLVSRVGVPPR